MTHVCSLVVKVSDNSDILVCEVCFRIAEPLDGHVFNPDVDSGLSQVACDDSNGTSSDNDSCSRV